MPRRRLCLNQAPDLNLKVKWPSASHYDQKQFFFFFFLFWRKKAQAKAKNEAPQQSRYAGLNRTLPLTRRVKIGLCAQNEDTIVGSVVNTTGRAYVISYKERRIFILISYNFASQLRH